MVDRPHGPPSRCGPLWSRPVGRFLARVWWATTARGVTNVPRAGGVIVIANHLGLIDGPLVHGLLRRSSHFLITSNMFKGPLKPLLLAAGQIRVSGSGRQALARARATLARGDVVGVFPEGTRGAGAAESVQGGAAWLALHSGAPVVPVAIFGTRRTGESANVWPPPRRPILVAFGDPVKLAVPKGLVGRARQQWAETRVAHILRDHVAQVALTTDIPLPGDQPVRRKEKS